MIDWVDVDTLNILSKKSSGVDVKIYTYPSARLNNMEDPDMAAELIRKLQTV